MAQVNGGRRVALDFCFRGLETQGVRHGRFVFGDAGSKVFVRGATACGSFLNRCLRKI